MHVLPRLSPQLEIGVVQKATRLKYGTSASWKILQWFLSAVCEHARRFAGASPNHSATCACTSGLVIQFIHLYMQFGCLALAATIQVSDHPVDPSEGSTVLTLCLSAAKRLAMICHVVPTVELPLANAAISLV